MVASRLASARRGGNGTGRRRGQIGSQSWGKCMTSDAAGPHAATRMVGSTNEGPVGISPERDASFWSSTFQFSLLFNCHFPCRLSELGRGVWACPAFQQCFHDLDVALSHRNVKRGGGRHVPDRICIGACLDKNQCRMGIASPHHQVERGVTVNVPAFDADNGLSHFGGKQCLGTRGKALIQGI